MKIDYSQIFRIGEDGIYFQNGVFYYSEIEKDEDGFAGEEKYEDGEFTVKFYGKSSFAVVFHSTSFGIGENAIKSARAKLGSFTLFLGEKGIRIK